jgi:hypothetical protein
VIGGKGSTGRRTEEEKMGFGAAATGGKEDKGARDKGTEEKDEQFSPRTYT